MNRGWFLALGVIALASSACAQVSISGGIYAPNSSSVRSVFGSNSFAWGFGLGDVGRVGRAGVGFDFAGLSLSAPGNRFFSIGTTYGYEWQDGQKEGTMKYARAGVGLAYYDYSLNAAEFGGASSGRSFKPITALEAGIVFNRQFSISAQYLMMSKVEDVDFSGFRLQAMFSIK
jgi:hypothetical protein